MPALGHPFFRRWCTRYAAPHVLLVFGAGTAVCAVAQRGLFIVLGNDYVTTSRRNTAALLCLPRYLSHRKISSVAVRHARPARRQQCKGHLRLFHEMLVHLLPACPTTQPKLPPFRAHGHHKPSVAYFHGAVPAKGTCVANAVPLHPGPILSLIHI